MTTNISTSAKCVINVIQFLSITAVGGGDEEEAAVLSTE